MTSERFNNTLDIWIKALQGYDYDQLTAKPSPTSWSIGQVYMHLLDDTSYHLVLILVCVTKNDTKMIRQLLRVKPCLLIMTFLMKF